MVISLSHAFSYQTDDASIKGFFETLSQQLRPGGLFLFDVWLGPAVLLQRPRVCLKRMEDAEIEVVRLSNAIMDAKANTVRGDDTIFARQ